MMRGALPRWVPLLAVMTTLTCARSLPPPEAGPTSDIPEIGAGAVEPEGEAYDGSIEPIPVPDVDATPRPDAPAGFLQIPERVRVGLATDLTSVVLPCCHGEVAAVHGERQIAVVSSLIVEPGVEAPEPASYRLQVAALRDESQAGDLASKIRESLGLETTVVFDAGTGLYRVRVGQFSVREEAEAERLRMVQHNIHEAWVVSEQRPPEDPELVVRQGARRWVVRDRWLRFEPRGEEGVSVLGRRYRGHILVFLNDRGTLNVINEVSLDDYLRGVVPREMGPEIFDNLEALKAQTVAARSYALRNIGEFQGEGYDICATPRCQVYGGMDAEHPLSDRAVLETSREVLVYQGEFVDALYSSTCGGHTEDVATVFPLKDEPYLQGVPCSEAGVDRIAGSLERGTSLEAGIGRLLVPPVGSEVTASGFAARLKTLARRAGLPTRTDSLASLERQEVQRFIASQFDLVVDARLLVNHTDIPYLLEAPPRSWTRKDLRLAAYLVKTGLVSGELDRPLAAREVDEAIFQLGLYLRVLEEVRVRYLGMDAGQLIVKQDGEAREYELSRELATFSRRSKQFGASPLAVVPGDRLRLFTSGGKLIGIAHEVDLDGAAYDRTSNMSSWTRFRSDSLLKERVRQRYPSIDFLDLEVLERGVSGRVGRLRIRGQDDSVTEVSGLPVRWTLDLPDTLFTAKRLKPAGGTSGWLFTGRGWGHGVGMCQVGSYGMAVRGHDYHDILHHYYSGVEVWRAPPQSESLSEETRFGGSG